MRIRITHETVYSYSEPAKSAIQLLRLTPRGMKTIEHNGGIDAYLLGTNDSKLSPEMKVLKRRVVSAKAKKDAKKVAA